MSHALIEYPDRDILALDLADQLAAELRMQLQHADRVALAVPGGTSPGPVFDALSGVDLPWGRVDVVLSDERWVPESSPRSNTALVRARLLTDRAAAANLVPLYQEGMDPQAGVDALSRAVAPVLPLGVVLLGMGADLHTASLFPGSDALHAALASDAPPVMAITAPGAPEPRVTLTARVLDGAMAKHVLIFGEEKRAALQSASRMSAQEAPINAVLSGAKVHWAA